MRKEYLPDMNRQICWNPVSTLSQPTPENKSIVKMDAIDLIDVPFLLIDRAG
jgi:hypothetical protein